MARCAARCSNGGFGLHHAIEHPYYVKKMPYNPYIGTVHDGTTQTYLGGFSSKKMGWLHRFRHNLLPVGIPLGHFGRNPLGKHVHWLEVSSIEKMRLQFTCEEALPMASLAVAVTLFTCYHIYRLAFLHPDITLYNIAMWTNKPFVMANRFSGKHPMDQPTWKYFQRNSEWYMYDSFRELIRLGVVANDPFVEKVRKAGKFDDLTLYPHQWTATRPNIIPEIFAHDPKPPASWSFFST